VQAIVTLRKAGNVRARGSNGQKPKEREDDEDGAASMPAGGLISNIQGRATLATGGQRRSQRAPCDGQRPGHTPAPVHPLHPATSLLGDIYCRVRATVLRSRCRGPPVDPEYLLYHARSSTECKQGVVEPFGRHSGRMRGQTPPYKRNQGEQ